MVSADCHAQEPARTWPSTSSPSSATASRTSSGATTARSGSITEGNRPQLVKRGDATATVQARQSFEQAEHNRHSSARMEPEDVLRNTSGLHDRASASPTRPPTASTSS